MSAPFTSLPVLPVSRWFLPVLGSESPFQVVFGCAFQMAVAIFIFIASLFLRGGVRQILLVCHFLALSSGFLFTFTFF